jgi:hypothetical protein
MPIDVKFKDGAVLDEYPELFSELMREEKLISSLPWNFILKEGDVEVYVYSGSGERSYFSYVVDLKY